MASSEVLQAPSFKSDRAGRCWGVEKTKKRRGKKYLNHPPKESNLALRGENPEC